MLTTVGYTDGALKVAVDEEVALILLRADDEDRDGQRFVSEFPHRIDFPEPCWLRLDDGARLEVGALEWTETIHMSPHTTVIEGKGEPMLVLEQLDEKGEATFGRLVVDRDLYAWDVEADGRVVERGELRVTDAPE